MKIIFFLFLLLTASITLSAQQRDSLATAPLPDSIPAVDSTAVLDSVEVKKGLFAFFSKDYPNPKKAAYLSLAFPGGGQIYNKRWWKLPLVYGALGGVVYAIDYNQDVYRLLKTAYQQKLNDEPITDPKALALGLDRLDPRSLRLFRDRYDKNTQLSYIGLVVVYALQSVEAFVDAHLKTFDVNEDLSLQLKPSFQQDVLAGQPALGIGVALRFD